MGHRRALLFYELLISPPGDSHCQPHPGHHIPTTACGASRIWWVCEGCQLNPIGLLMVLSFLPKWSLWWSGHTYSFYFPFLGWGGKRVISLANHEDQVHWMILNIRAVLHPFPPMFWVVSVAWKIPPPTVRGGGNLPASLPCMVV